VRFTHPGAVEIWGGPQALRELERRYLATYGPATRQDFAAWWGESAAHAQTLLDSLDTVVVEVDGTRALLLRQDARRALAARRAERCASCPLSIPTSFAWPSASVRSAVSAEAERLAVFLGCTLQRISWTV
jgi:hypothetical protein